MVSGLAVRRRVDWPQTFRIIRSIHPPIDLFEDIADPRDWEALASVEAKTNPRIRFEIGDLGKVSAARRVSGPGASFVMAPFVHCSTLRPGRFSDGSYGIYYAGDSEDVALAETIHHHQKFMRATNEGPGWTADFRVLIGSVDRDLDDVNAVPGVLDPDDYSASQAEGRALRAGGSDGLVWN
ncbi:RES domain-containing protein, partial [Mesorhizobium sp. M7A.F.Ca.CA.004.01.1.1]